VSLRRLEEARRSPSGKDAMRWGRDEAFRLIEVQTAARRERTELNE
jgi:hypothetical protein